MLCLSMLCSKKKKKKRERGERECRREKWEDT